MAEPIVNTIYLKQFAWNAVTFDNSNGGTIALDFTHEGEVIQDWTGVDEYSKFLSICNKILECTLRLRNVKRKEGLGTANGDITGLLAGASDVPFTFKTMSLVGVRGGQGRTSMGEAALRFRHKSSDGTTVPITD